MVSSTTFRAIRGLSDAAVTFNKGPLAIRPTHLIEKLQQARDRCIVNFDVQPQLLRAAAGIQCSHDGMLQTAEKDA